MAPPVVRLACAYGVGAAWVLIGAPLALAPPAALIFLLLPKSPSAGPAARGVLVSAAVAALLSTLTDVRTPTCGTGPSREAGAPAVLRGRFLADPRGGAAPFRPDSGCGVVTVVLGGRGVPVGRPVAVEGHWRDGGRGPYFLGREATPEVGRGAGGEWRGGPVRWRAGLLERLDRLYGPRAPLVAALTLARREGFDPDLRETFARVGIAHLLAISGFHVGLLAVVFVIVLRSAGCGRRASQLGAATAAWGYVAFIGFPDAACRAALILTLAAGARWRGRPSARWGPVASSFLVLVVAGPARIASPGFLLSFAGAAGLVAWAAPLSAALRRLSRKRCPRALATALAAGVAATLATLPIVGWYFERISLVGIPYTLIATPLVALGLVGALASLALDFVWPAAGAFLAGGVSVLLAALEASARFVAAWEWASVWTTRSTVAAAVCGVAVASLVARQPRVGARARRRLVGTYVVVGVLSWPLLLRWQGLGTTEVLMIDVGQGDAIAIRTPHGRWLLVDAGPPGRDPDPGAHPVVRALRQRGVRRLEAMLLTHADLDHIGGAAAVLRSFEVGRVLDPGVPAGKREFVDLLSLAAERDVPWRAARAGDELAVDDVTVRILYPAGDLDPEGETNASSVVAVAEYGEFDALLTGDAYKDVDRLLAPSFDGGLELLKVGHHGSDTSTDSLLLARAGPSVALVSVGERNRYGHPDPDVLGRLERAGVEVHRTDLEGSISVVARPDGTFALRAERPAAERPSPRAPEQP